ncbi:MAG: class B sortase [Oscillospiraceae bacterium]|nr:class B sortase [Oscillospiraceae bacterium]
MSERLELNNETGEKKENAAPSVESITLQKTEKPEKTASFEQRPQRPQNSRSSDSKPQGRSQSSARAIAPMKGGKAAIIRNFVFIISFIVVIVCVAVILHDMSTSRRNDELYNGIRAMVALEGEVSLSDGIVEETGEIIPDILDDYIAVFNENNDTVGWVSIPGTKIDYPVLQYRHYKDDGSVTGSNFYYLDKNFYHQDSKHGAIYAEWRYPIGVTRPNNTVLYGHNMGDGSMFAAVTHYYPFYTGWSGSIDFYQRHPLVYFDTLYERGVYKVFAVMYVHVEEDKYDDVYNYFRKREFPDRDSFNDFIVNIMDRSAFYTDVDLEYGDEILTLSTCYYAPLGTGVDARIAVFARRVREGESADVNVDAAIVNQSPLYFDIYYRSIGGSWAGRTWDISKVSGLTEEMLRQAEAEGRITPDPLQMG